MINFTSGATVTANGTTAEVAISGGGGGSGVTQYAVRVDYNANSEVSNYNKVSTFDTNFTITLNDQTTSNGGYNLVLDFPNEATPPIAIHSFGYIAATDQYSIGTFSANANKITGQTFSTTIESDNSVTTDFFSDFDDAELTINVEQPADFAASRAQIEQDFPNPTIVKEAHVVLLFSF